jgi:hypothetical protein
MHTAPGLRSFLVLFGLVVASLLGGCGQPVREDRTIQFNAGGGQVGFQHAAEGVYLADPNGGPPRKIFQPDAGVVAVSTPLWSPGGKQAVFLTATSPGQQPQTIGLNGSPEDPAGQLFYQGPITYTCWKYDATGPEGTKPRQLFSAGLNHAGYVGANLAVRWHPSEPKLYFLSQVSQHVGLFELDLTTGKQTQAFSETAEGMIFDWTPDGSHLVCVLGFSEGNAAVNGTWIGKPGATNWWHVPGSADLAQPKIPSLLETLRASRPIFTSNTSYFAFAASTRPPGTNHAAPDDHAVHLGNMVQRTTKVLTHGQEPIRNLLWHPDGKRLGLVRADAETGSLHTLPLNGPQSPPLTDRRVRQFAGWNSKGDDLAYVTPEKIPTLRKDYWSFLLVPDPLARDAVVLKPGSQHEKTVLDGLRVTFPTWSPTENKLSLWVTFAPCYRSWLWLFLRYGLRPGDPAAIFDVGSGKLSWLAVNDYERSQIGRYFHLKKEYQQAWEWYEKSKGAGTPLSGILTNTGLPAVNEQLFYEYLCLSKLGRAAEAQERLARFEAAFSKTPQGKAGVAQQVISPLVPEISDRKDFYFPLMHDFLIAEVFLSLDAAEDGADFFRTELQKADSDGKRLGAAITLGQILLVQGKHEEYAAVCSASLAPLLIKDAKSHAPRLQLGSVLELIIISALAPLAASDFVKQLPVANVERELPVWRNLASEAAPTNAAPLFNYILIAALERADKMAELSEARTRLTRTPPPIPGLVGPQSDWNAGLADFRKQLEQFLAW